MNHAPVSVALMLGGNLGDSRAVFDAAIHVVTQNEIRLLAASKHYRSAPWGRNDQPEFINQAILVETGMDAFALHAFTQAVEAQFGRTRSGPTNGPRILDIDLLLFGDRVIESDGLMVPHPRMHARRFNLLPLCEIAPGWMHPVLHKTIAELLEACSDPLAVEPLETE